MPSDGCEVALTVSRRVRGKRPSKWLALAIVSGVAVGCARETNIDGDPMYNESSAADDAASQTRKRDAGSRPGTSGASSSDAGSRGMGATTRDAGRDARAGAASAPKDAGLSNAHDPDEQESAEGETPAEGDVDDPCGADAELVRGTTRTQGAGDTNLQTSGNVEILSVRTTLRVPSKPAPTRGTVFLWPGLQPLRSDSTIGYGVLQPVLTWGASCAPGSLSTYDQWWISSQYVGSPPGSLMNIKCEGGDVMKVDVGDELDISMTLEGTVWTQVVTNQSNGKSVRFERDMKGQKQQWLIHEIEVTGMTKPVDDVIFTSLVVELSDSLPRACVPNVKGAMDYFTPPRASADGKTCCIDKLILRASGIKPSSPDAP